MLKSKLNGGNMINAINIWAVATIQYGAGIINWNKGELDKIDRQTRKPLNMHRGLHPHSSVDRLYIPRAQRGKGLLSVKDCVERSNLFDYSANDNERLLKVATEGLQLMGMGRIKKSKRMKGRQHGKRKHCMVNS